MKVLSNKIIAQWISCLIVSALVAVFCIFSLSLERKVNAAVFNVPGGDVSALIAAINTANSNGEADTINLEAGIYLLTEVNNIVPWEEPDDRPYGLPSITSDITINGDSAETTIIRRYSFSVCRAECRAECEDGDEECEDECTFGCWDLGLAEFCIFHVGETGTLALENLSIKNGGGEPWNVYVGGVDNFGTSLDISDCNISENDAIGIRNISGNLTIIDSRISDNGTGISNGGTATITNSIIESNGASGIGNGGIMTITNTTISGNSSASFSGEVGGFGGGIGNGGTLTMTNSTVSDNSAGFGGGGINNHGILDISNSTIADNSTDDGLGGGILMGIHSILTMTNSTVAHNYATFHGGGLSMPGDVSTSFGTVELQNTIVAGNTSFIGRGPDCFEGEITSLGNNIIGDITDCVITLLPSDKTGDPGLDPFVDSVKPGGGYCPLQSDSIAIDAGNDTACLETDQIGIIRPLDGDNDGNAICDIGAVEYLATINNHVAFVPDRSTFMSTSDACDCSLLGLTDEGLIDIYPGTGAGILRATMNFPCSEWECAGLSDIDYRGDGILFGIGGEGSDGPPSLYTIDPTTGSRSIVGPTGWLCRIEFAESTLVGLDENKRYWQTVDDETGQSDWRGGPDYDYLWCSNPEETHDFAYDASTDTMYELTWFESYCGESCYPCIWHDVTDLYAFDMTTGETTLVGPYVAGYPRYRSLEFNNCNGIMYGSDEANLYTIDPATGVRTLIGPIGYNLGGLTFNPNEFVGKFSFDARLTNTSNKTLSDMFVKVVTLTNENSCRNFDGGPGEIGTRMTIPIPIASDYSDGELSPGESVNVHFDICLKEWKRFRFFVDVLGVPGS